MVESTPLSHNYKYRAEQFADFPSGTIQFARPLVNFNPTRIMSVCVKKWPVWGHLVGNISLMFSTNHLTRTISPIFFTGSRVVVGSPWLLVAVAGIYQQPWTYPDEQTQGRSTRPQYPLFPLSSGSREAAVEAFEFQWRTRMVTSSGAAGQADLKNVAMSVQGFLTPVLIRYATLFMPGCFLLSLLLPFY